MASNTFGRFDEYRLNEWHGSSICDAYCRSISPVNYVKYITFKAIVFFSPFEITQILRNLPAIVGLRIYPWRKTNPMIIAVIYK